jgi:hypothetical protein
VSTNAAHISLDYVSPQERRANLAFLWVSLVCGILAWAGGVGILGLFWLTGANALLGYGAVWLGAGGVLTLTGLVSGIIYGFQVRGETAPLRSSLRPGNLALLVSLANVPTALLCVLAGGVLMSMPVVNLVISNVGTKRVQHCTLQVGDQRIEGGPILSNASITRRVRLRGAGAMAIHVTRDGLTASINLLDHVDVDDDVVCGNCSLVIDIDDSSAVQKSW